MGALSSLRKSIDFKTADNDTIFNNLFNISSNLNILDKSEKRNRSVIITNEENLNLNLATPSIQLFKSSIRSAMLSRIKHMDKEDIIKYAKNKFNKTLLMNS